MARSATVQVLLPWQFIRVEGPSMTPTLVPGDLLLVRYGAHVRPGCVVLARFRSRPDLLVIKRALRPLGDGWWLASDNTRAGSDSRELGVADVDAVALWMWRRGAARASRGALGGKPLARLIPQRVTSQFQPDM